MLELEDKTNKCTDRLSATCITSMEWSNIYFGL